MEALSYKQPWALLVAEGIKPIENRTWKCPQKYIGKRVLIHASMKPDNIKLEIEGQASVKEIEMFSALGRAEDDNLFGCIIGSVEIVDCVQNHPSMWAERTINAFCSAHGSCRYDLTDDTIDCETCSSWSKSKPIWNWVLANPILFPKPIPAKGKLSFWESGIEVCHICGQPCDLICAQCGEYFCQKHTVRYNQFTQIDYDCCTACAPTGPESE